MPTFKELVDEVTINLQGFTLRQDRSTHLTANTTSTATTMTLSSADNVAKGIIQIEDELIWVDSYDKNTGIVTIPPYGRGYLGTTKSSHTSGTQVIIKPTYPRGSVKKAINDTVKAVFPTVFGTGTYTFDYNASQVTYALPNNVETVLAVSWQSTGPTQEWYPVRSWRIDPMANTPEFNSNNSLSIYDAITPGRTVQVFFTAQPDTFELDADDFEDVTNLPISCKDVIVYGAAYRMASMIDPGRLTLSSPEADLQANRIPAGSGTNAARYLLALYTQRLDEESKKLRERYPIRVHYTR
jgi:hypothetical protein